MIKKLSILGIAFIALIVSSCGQSNDVSALMQQAAVAYGRGDYSQCISVLSQVISQQPSFVNAYVQRAGCYNAEGDTSAAISDLEKAIKLSPRNVPLYIQLAALWQQLGNSTNESDYYEKALKLSNVTPEQYLSIAQGLGAIQEYSSAMNAVDAGISKYYSYYALYQYKADLYVALHNWNQALLWWGKALKVASNPPDQASIYDDRGQNELNKGLNAQAVKDFEQAVTLEPNNATYYDQLGQAEQADGNFEQAASSYNKAVRLCIDSGKSCYPTAAGYLDQLGRDYLAMHDAADAANSFRQGLSLLPPGNSSLRSQLEQDLASIR